jgi:CRISPR-associated endonuclease/helicase Cas3
MDLRRPADLAVNIWAKTDMHDFQSMKWASLTQHLIDTALVSGYVYDCFLSNHVKTTLDTALNGHARVILAFLAGVHDVGKCTPAFEKQAKYRSDLMRNLEDNGFIIPNIGKSSELRHEISGFYALKAWLSDHHVDQELADRLSIIVGGHHGVFHEVEKYSEHTKARKAEYYGSGLWNDVRTDVIEVMSARTGFNAVMADLDAPSITQPIQSILTGTVVVSDWIASSTFLFELTSEGLSDQRDETERVRRAWKQLGLPSPWSYTQICDDKTALHERFGLPDAAKLNAMQSDLHALAMKANTPSLFIVEAPMGGGKTEASLIAAESIARNTGAGGLVFALPTQATADGIFPRVKNWITKSTNDRESFELLHGSAFLNEDFNQLKNTLTWDDGFGIEVNRWFDGSKRGLLANFVVSTIDQILMAALQSKHFDLRHLGLANKVVIIDEVHAADEYMSVYLDRAIEWLAALGSSVILLSATLPKERRKSMVRSYQRGLQATLKKIEPPDDAYPLITTVDSSDCAYRVPHLDSASKTIAVRHLCQSEYHDVMELLDDKLSDGGNAVIIKNTVKSAQDVFQQILDSGKYSMNEVILLHSHFISYDRHEIENIIRSCYGPKGERPKRSIVVGTQILEQSLDIDFDIMVSDLAPIDLMLQRAGRLHRHDGRIRPRKLSEPELWVDGWTDQKNGYDFDTGSLYVYGSGHEHNKVASRLMRSLELLKAHPTITIPDDICPLVQAGYDYDRIIDTSYPEILAAEDIRQKENMTASKIRAAQNVLRPPYRTNRLLRNETRLDKSEAGVLWGSNEKSSSASDEKLRAQVRDSAFGISVIMMIRDADGGLEFVPESLREDYGVINEDLMPDYELQKKIAEQTIGIPSTLSGPWIVDRMISWLENNGKIESWQQASLLKGELVLLLDEHKTAIIQFPNDSDTSYEIHYDDMLGLEINKMSSRKDTHELSA